MSPLHPHVKFEGDITEPKQLLKRAGNILPDDVVCQNTHLSLKMDLSPVLTQPMLVMKTL